MALELRGVTQRNGADKHIHETNLVFEQGSFIVLLGTTLAGKTTLMQIIAGIQKPTTGSIWFKGQDVTKLAVQKRNVSMVYQQFINYPNFNVYDNIASPLRVANMSRDEIDARVQKAANLLRLTPMLSRKPSELSGGQQQRTAIARALVKDSDIILLDEPLANLDYKLREELRDELPKLFADRDAIVVYATTEPSEALLFGGNTATMHEGRVAQFGPTGAIYRKPANLMSAQVFSEPPMNTAKITKRGKHLNVFGNVKWPAGRAEKLLPDGEYIIGVRPHNMTIDSKGAAVGAISGEVLVTEISGSESIIHTKIGGDTWISQSHGVHLLNVGATAKLFVNIDQSLFFGTNHEFIG